MATTLIIPGLNSSGSAHWQTWLESQVSNAVRVIQSDWKRADLAQWSSRVRRTISRNPGRFVVVAHSFGVLAAVQAASDYSERIAGALLVAPADPQKFGVENLIPRETLPFPTTLVASTNDPWLSFENARSLADIWGAEFINLGAAGHINADAGFGPWPLALSLLSNLESKSPPANQSYQDGGRSIRPDIASRSRVISSAAVS